MCRQPVPHPPSYILRKTFQRMRLPRFAVQLPAIVKEELQQHPEVERVVTYAFLTVDSTELLRVLRAIGL